MMNTRYYFAFFWALIVPSLLFAQAKINVDSLIAVLNKYPKDDTVKVRMLLKLTAAYWGNKPQKGIVFAEQALSISMKLQEPLFVGEAYLLKGQCLSGVGKLQEAIDTTNLALTIFEKAENHTKTGNCWLGLGSYYSRLKAPEKAIECFNKAKTSYEKGKYMLGVGKALNGVATAYLNTGKPSEALPYLEEGLKSVERYGNKNDVSSFNGNLGMAHLLLSNYNKSLDYYLKALPVIEETNKKNILAGVYNNLSILYDRIGDSNKALEYQLKSLKIAKEMNNKRGVAENLNNAAVRYSVLKDYKQAKEYHLQALEIAETLKDSSLLYLFYSSAGGVYTESKEYDKGYRFVTKSMSASDAVLADGDVANNYLNLGKIYHLAPDSTLLSLKINPKERFAMAETAYLKGIRHASSGDFKNTQSNLLNQISFLYEENKDYTKAYQYFKQYISLNDSISGSEVKKGFMRKEIEYEFDRKALELKYQQQLTAEQLEKQKLLTREQGQSLTLNEQALSLSQKDLLLANKEKDLTHLAYLKEQAEKQEKAQQLSLSEEREKGKERDLTLKSIELSAQQRQNLYLGLLAALLFSGLGALIYFYGKLKKQKDIIAQQHELTEHTMAILSHDIKEPLLGVKLLLKKLNKDDPFVAQASLSLENQINSVNGILNNLLKVKKIALDKKDIKATSNVREVVQEVTQELGIAIQSKALQVNNELPDTFHLPVAPEKLRIVVHNLLSNAVKYSFHNQQIRIIPEEKGFCIQDFGVGLSPEQRSKLMREVTASQKGTGMERGNGLGLFLVGAILQGEVIRVVFDSPDTGGTIVKVLNA